MFATVISTLFVLSCANKLAPGGGPPDKTPANLIHTEPADRSTNVTDPSFVFEFDDYVDRSIRNAISIQPAARFSTSYYGDEIAITFDEDLLPNTTYAITLGTEWKDLRGNSPTAAATIIFSTGPGLDSGVIQGQVSAGNLQELFVFAYPNAETLDTSFSPAADPAVYRIPVGTSGAFMIGGLKDGLYRVLVARDRNKNLIVDPGEDFAIDYSDIQVSSGLSRKSNLKIDNPIDTSAVIGTGKGADTLKPDTSKSRIEPGSATGVFADSVNFGPPYLLRLTDKSGSIQAAVSVVNGETWTISSVAPGTYTVDVVKDDNGNGFYDPGTVRPFTFGERWRPIGISITIRERWTTEGISIFVR